MKELKPSIIAAPYKFLKKKDAAKDFFFHPCPSMTAIIKCHPTKAKLKA